MFIYVKILSIAIEYGSCHLIEGATSVSFYFVDYISPAIIVEFESLAARRLTQVNELAKTSIQANDIAIRTCREHNSRLREAMDVNLEEVIYQLLLYDCVVEIVYYSIVLCCRNSVL